MKADVRILCTVRRMDLLASSLLVFRSLRVGFPTAQVFVTPNLPGALRLDDHETAVESITAAAREVGAVVQERDHTRHDHWLEHLILRAQSPFVIVDTDMVFHASMEGVATPEPLVGPWEPTHLNPVTGMQHQGRLHTCCLYVDPSAVRFALREVVRDRLPKQPWMIDYTPVRGSVEFSQNPKVRPDKFWDTAARLLHVVQYSCLAPEDLARFTHLHAGTWRDHAGAKLPGLNEAHQCAIRGDIDFAEVRAAQARWYQANQ